MENYKAFKPIKEFDVIEFNLISDYCQITEVILYDNTYMYVNNRGGNGAVPHLPFPESFR